LVVKRRMERKTKDRIKEKIKANENVFQRFSKEKKGGNKPPRPPKRKRRKGEREK